MIDALADRFDIMETGYTAAMEAELDNIAGGTADYLTVVRDYDLALDSQLADFIQSSIEDGSIRALSPMPKWKTAPHQWKKRSFLGVLKLQGGLQLHGPR